jgi:hypothetical protein
MTGLCFGISLFLTGLRIGMSLFLTGRCPFLSFLQELQHL